MADTPDINCVNSMGLTRGAQEVVGDTPEDVVEFKNRYRQDADYQNHIDTVWGARAYDTRPGVDIDYKTNYGLDNGWGYSCTGILTNTIGSRSNAQAANTKCCSKFKKGQVAFNLPGPPKGPAGNHDCGYAWSGVRAHWDPDDLVLRRHHAPPNWYNDILQLEAKPLLECDEGGNLLSGRDFAELDVVEQLLHLLAIHRCICYESPPFGHLHQHTETAIANVCGECSNKIEDFINIITNFPGPAPAVCRNIIRDIFILYINLHRIAEDKVGDIRMRGRVKKGLRKFTKDFLRLCNALTQAGGLLRNRSYKIKQKRKKTKRKKTKHKKCKIKKCKIKKHKHINRKTKKHKHINRKTKKTQTKTS